MTIKKDNDTGQRHRNNFNDKYLRTITENNYGIHITQVHAGQVYTEQIQSGIKGQLRDDKKELMGTSIRNRDCPSDTGSMRTDRRTLPVSFKNGTKTSHHTGFD